MSVTALIVAAGRGTRAGGDIPKQYQSLAGMPILSHTLRALASHPRVSATVLVVHPDDRAGHLAKVTLPQGTILVDGGATRDASVRAGLAALPDGTAEVLIHDAARPLLAHDVIERVLVALCNHPGAAPALPVTDALWRGSFQAKILRLRAAPNSGACPAAEPAASPLPPAGRTPAT
ncbi:IspD/TarI family cytidylyltransferase [Mangrovicoccus ximenensis]|uniref:IspD/TarI family cytidylyltransferase n=1 Tax=Mangrovicoccus ximenensis TaxID=1911570 RepID=UPI000D3889A6|nr:2-C-methyl-D-erythritol 4-phosphate cytidylyltransferase [Mangrovicoccus ximenensis]